MQSLNTDMLVELGKNLDYKQLLSLCASNKNIYQQCQDSKFKSLVRAKAQRYDEVLFENRIYTSGSLVEFIKEQGEHLVPDTYQEIDLKSSVLDTTGLPDREISVYIREEKYNSYSIVIREITRSTDSIIASLWDSVPKLHNPNVRLSMNRSLDHREHVLEFVIDDGRIESMAHEIFGMVLTEFYTQESQFWRAELDHRIQRILHDVLYHAEPYSTPDGSVRIHTNENRIIVESSIPIAQEIPNDGIVDRDKVYWKIVPGDLDPEDLEAIYLSDLADLMNGHDAEFNAYGYIKRLLIIYFAGGFQSRYKEPYWE